MYITLISSILLGIAAFLPWGSAFEFSTGGLQGDGKITLIISVLLLVLFFFKKITLWASFALGAITIAFGIIDIYNLNLIEDTRVGIGLYLTVIAGLGICIGNVYHRKLINHDPHLWGLSSTIIGALLVLIALFYPSAKIPYIAFSITGGFALGLGTVIEAHRYVKKIKAKSKQI